MNAAIWSKSLTLSQIIGTVVFEMAEQTAYFI